MDDRLTRYPSDPPTAGGGVTTRTGLVEQATGSCTAAPARRRRRSRRPGRGDEPGPEGAGVAHGSGATTPAICPVGAVLSPLRGGLETVIGTCAFFTVRPCPPPRITGRPVG